MNKRAFVIILCLGIPLFGCSSKPDVGDIDAQIQAIWQPCELLRVTDLKKTNGIDQGNTYELAYSYKLVFQKDVSDWPSAGICPIDQLNLLWTYAKAVNKAGVAMKKGEFIEVNDSATMVKSEKGWVTQ